MHRKVNNIMNFVSSNMKDGSKNSVNLPVKIGWLEKKESGLFGSWQKRFVMLSHKKLMWCETDKV